MQDVDILIKNGTVVAMDPDNTIIEDGAVAVKGDEIVKAGAADEFARTNAREIIDAGGGIIMPGLINTHTHAAMACFRGLADDLDLMTWLNDYIFPAEARLDHQTVKMGALLACAEMILSGTTCFCDMYLFEDAVAEAARDAGIRAVVGEVLYDFPSPNYGPIEKGFEYTRDLIEQWRGHPLVTVAVEPHSPYLCSPDLLRRAAGLSERYNIPLVMHVSETQNEVDRTYNDYGNTPVGHLADIGVLSPRLVACHCVMLSETDIRLLADHGVKVSHNPESNMKLASGIAPIPELIEAGVCVGLGTDGCTSNNNLDLLAEMDMAAKIHKVNRLDPTVMDAQTVVRMATIEAARVLGMDRITGSIEAGKKADLIIIDTSRPHLTPMYNIYSHLVYAAAGSDVAASMINGRMVMRNRRITTLDIENIMADVRRVAESIQSGFSNPFQKGAAD